MSPNSVSSKYSGIDTAEIITLWIEPRNGPAAVLASIENPFMEAAAALAPEFDLVGLDPEAGPMRRPRDVAGAKLKRDLSQAAYEMTVAFKRPALVRGPRAHLGQAWPGLPISVCFGR